MGVIEDSKKRKNEIHPFFYNKNWQNICTMPNNYLNPKIT